MIVSFVSLPETSCATLTSYFKIKIAQFVWWFTGSFPCAYAVWIEKNPINQSSVWSVDGNQHFSLLGTFISGRSVLDDEFVYVEKQHYSDRRPRPLHCKRFITSRSDCHENQQSELRVTQTSKIIQNIHYWKYQFWINAN